MKKNTLTIGPLNIEKEIRFDGLFIKITIDDFISKGFNYGDSLDLFFSNNQILTDVPFYSAYYIKYGEPVVVGYQGYPYIDFTFNFTGGVMKKLNLTQDDTVIITLNKKAKYQLIQTAFAQNHSNDRKDYISNESFCNYREITKSNKNESLIYRSSSPCDDDYNRAYYVSELCRKYNVNYIIDLSNDQNDLDKYYKNKETNNQYWKKLYEENKVIPTRLDANYRSKKCANTIINALRFIIDNSGPFMMHCAEGKDRTGFFAIIIKAIMGHTLDEIEQDYMLTYGEYYNITKQNNQEKYKAIKELYFDSMIEYLCNNKLINTLSNNDIYTNVENYLLTNGMSEKEINLLKKRLI